MIAIYTWVILGNSFNVYDFILAALEKKIKWNFSEMYAWGTMLCLGAMCGPFFVAFMIQREKKLKLVIKRAIIYAAMGLSLGACITEKTKVFVCTICSDGRVSHSTGRGTCSWHGGIDHYEYRYWWE